MKNLTCLLRGFTVLGLMLFLSGCLIAAQGDHGRVVVADNPPPPSLPIGHKKHGPPPHAKAHGYHAKYCYRYYPDIAVYFDTGRNLYFHLDTAGNWRVSATLPLSLKVHLGTNVTIEMDTDRPYIYYEQHRKKYPPKKKKKHKKK